MHHLNPFLWITICIVVTNGLLDENVDPDSRDLSSSGYDQNLNADFPNSLNFTDYLRSARNANDKSAEYLNHITSIAHIVNGIALQNGLMNGNVPIDGVIEELLNFGSVKLSSVIQFKPDSIKNFGSKLKTVPGKFDKSADSLEKQALKWNKWYKQYLSVKDVSFEKLPRSSEYFIGTKTISSSKIFESLNALKGFLREMISAADVIESNIKKSLDDFGVTDIIEVRFKQLDHYSRSIVNSFTTLRDAVSKHVSQSLLKEGHVIFEPLESMLEVMKGRQVVVQSTPELIESIKGNVKIAVGLAKDSTAADGDISLITDLMKSQNEKKPNKHTIGFPNGASDMKQLEKDAVNSWIAKILNLDVTRLSALSDSLKPLFLINEKLDGLDGKVKSIVSDEAYESLLKLQGIQKELAEVSKDSINSIYVLGKYDNCFNNGNTLSDTTLSDNFISNMHELTKGLMDIEKLVNDLKDDTLKQEVDEYLKFLGFTKIADDATVKKELPEAVKKYNAGNNLDKIKKHVNEIQSKLAVVNGTDIQSKLSSVVATNGNIINQKFNDEITQLGKIHTCLATHLSNSDKSSKAIQAIQKLKIIDTKSIDTVESLATTISGISKSLSGIQSIGDVMKKDVKEVTKEINKLEKSTTQSEVIGQSMVSLKYALGLIQMETEINHLKGLGNAVEAEIRKVDVAKKGIEIQEQWGDHKKDIGDLEKSLSGIKAFGQKLNVSTNGTLEEYSTPLIQLTSFQDVKVNFKEKSKALRALIQQTTDQNIKSDLEKAQETLDKLSNLDLEFSSHKTQYTSAPSAFLAVQDFLTKFLSIDHNITVIEEKAAEFPWAIVAGVALALIIIFFTGMAASFFWERHKSRRGYMKARQNAWREKGATSVDLMLWIRGRRYKSSKKWEEVHYGTETIVRHKERQCEKVKIPKKFKKVSRSPGVIRCNPATAVSYKYGIFPWTKLTIHANWIVTADGKEFIATQAPVKDEDGLRNTDVDFWRMVFMSKSDTIAMLCKKKEMFEGKEFQVCGEYFSDEEATQIQCGPFTIATLCVMPVANDVIKRTLSLTYKNVTKEITHYQFVNWSLSSHPPDHANVLELMKEVYKSDKPIVVHCTDGVNRTMDFIALRYIYEEVFRDATIVFGDCCLKLRECRWYSFQNAVQSQWVEAGVIRQIKLGQHQDEIDEIYQRLLGYLNRQK